MEIVGLGERGHLGRVVAELKGGVVGVAFGTGGLDWLLGSEEALKGGGVGVGVEVGVLKLVDVADAGEVLSAAGVIFLKSPHPLEDSPVWFIYFHKL